MWVCLRSMAVPALINEDAHSPTDNVLVWRAGQSIGQGLWLVWGVLGSDGRLPNEGTGHAEEGGEAEGQETAHTSHTHTHFALSSIIWQERDCPCLAPTQPHHTQTHVLYTFPQGYTFQGFSTESFGKVIKLDFVVWRSNTIIFVCLLYSSHDTV